MFFYGKPRIITIQESQKIWKICLHPPQAHPISTSNDESASNIVKLSAIFLFSLFLQITFRFEGKFRILNRQRYGGYANIICKYALSFTNFDGSTKTPYPSYQQVVTASLPTGLKSVLRFLHPRLSSSTPNTRSIYCKAPHHIWNCS